MRLLPASLALLLFLVGCPPREPAEDTGPRVVSGVTRDATQGARAAHELKYPAQDCLGRGVADEVIPEPLGGAHRDPDTTIAAVGEAIERHLNELLAIGEQDIAADRYDRFRKLGVIAQAAAPA